jgi:hypothetical protein
MEKRLLGCSRFGLALMDSLLGGAGQIWGWCLV